MIYVMDNNENVTGVLSIDLPNASPYYDDTFTENLDGSRELTFKVPVKRKGEDEGKQTFGGYRYIRHWMNGNTSNAPNYFNEIEAYVGATNVCAGKTVTSSTGTFVIGSASNITDGDYTTFGIPAYSGENYVTVDLGQTYPIESVKVWHYYLDNRIFFSIKVQVSIDGTDWVTIYQGGDRPYIPIGTTMSMDKAYNVVTNLTTPDGDKLNYISSDLEVFRDVDNAKMVAGTSSSGTFNNYEVYPSDTGNDVRFAQTDTDKFLAVVNNAGALKILYFQDNETSYTLLDEYELQSSDVDLESPIAEISDNNFLIMYKKVGRTRGAVITITSGSIAVKTDVEIAIQNFYFGEIAVVDTNLAIVSFQASSSNTPRLARGIRFNDTTDTLTWGTENYTTGTVYRGNSSICTYDTNKAIETNVNTAVYYTRYTLMSVNPSTLAISIDKAETQISTTAGYGTSVIQMDTNKVLLTYTRTNGMISSRTLSISGTTVTAGTLQDVTDLGTPLAIEKRANGHWIDQTSGLYGYNTQMFKNNQLVVAMIDGSDVVSDISSTTITYRGQTANQWSNINCPDFLALSSTNIVTSDVYNGYDGDTSLFLGKNILGELFDYNHYVTDYVTDTRYSTSEVTNAQSIDIATGSILWSDYDVYDTEGNLIFAKSVDLPLYEETIDGKLMPVPPVIPEDLNNIKDIADDIIIENLVIYKTRYNKLELMRIIEVNEANEDGTVIKDVVCENAGIGDLSRTLVVPKPTDEEGNIQETEFNIIEIMDYILTTSDWGYRIEYDASEDFEFLFDKYDNCYSYLKKLSELKGLDMTYDLKLQGLQIIEKTVVLKQLGDNSNTMFQYSIDLTEVTRKMDSKDVITTLLPVGSSDETKNKITIDSKFRTATIDPIFADDFVINGKEIYSKWALNRWGKGRHRIGYYENNDVTDPDLLLAYAQQELNNRIYPNIEYAMKLITYQEFTEFETNKDVRLGDTVLVVDKTFNPELRVMARIVELTTSRCDPAGDNLIVGNVQEVIQDPLFIIQDLKKTVGLGNGHWNVGVKGDVKKKEVYAETIRAGNQVLGTVMENITTFTGLNLSTNLYTFQVANATELNKLTDTDLPKFLSKRVEIQLTGNIQGNVYIEGFQGGGEIILVQNGYDIEGHVYFMRNTCRCGISATTGEINGDARSDVYGNIPAGIMLVVAGCSEFTAYGLNMTTNNSATYGIYVTQSTAIIEECDISGMTHAIYCKNSNVSLTSCVGSSNTYGVTSSYGGHIGSSNTIPIGTTASNNISATTSTAGTFTGTATGISPTTPTTKTQLFYPTDADTLKSSYPLGSGTATWQSSDDIRQGSWNDPEYEFLGFWAFGTAIYDLIQAATTVESIRLFINRKSGEGYSTTPINIHVHQTETIGAGTIQIYNANVEIEVSRGEGTWVDVTTLKTYFQSSNVGKGFCLWANNYRNESYANFFQDCVVEVTYT